jgi:hypothetical protein
MNNHNSHPKRYHLIVIFEDGTRKEILNESIENIDKFTMHYNNGTELVTKLIEAAELPDKSISQIIINYKANEEVKEIPVLYKNDINKVNQEYVNRKVHYYSSDIPFLKKYVAKYAKKDTRNELQQKAIALYIYAIAKENNIVLTNQDFTDYHFSIEFNAPIDNDNVKRIKKILENDNLNIDDNALMRNISHLTSLAFNKHNELEEMLKILLFNNYKKNRDNYLIIKNYEIIMGFKEDDTNYDLIYQKPISFSNEEDVLDEIERNKENSLENYYKLPEEKEIKFNEEDILEDEALEELELIKEETPKQKVKNIQVPNQISFYN